jgi:hypothetical protein
MQTGAVRHRGRWILRLAIAACAAGASPVGCRGQTAWEKGAGGAAVPRNICLQAGKGEGGLLFAGASAEQPWRLPGVLQTTGEIFLKTNCCIVRWRWERLASERYAEDLIEGSFGASITGAPLHAHIIGRLRRHCADGFPPAASTGAGWAIAVGPFAGFSAQAQRISRLHESGDVILPSDGEGWRLSAAAGGGGVLFVASLDRTRLGIRSPRIGLIVGGSGKIRFAFGTRPGTGEISGGIQCCGAVTAAVSWRMHPTLGISVSFGAGVTVR